MKGFPKLILTTVIIFASDFSLAQNEYSKWYFGNYAALDFMTSPPTPIFNSAMATAEAASSIADGSGNLLFYTNGVDIWNQQHTLMANGSGLLGNTSSSQGALIVKQPGNTNIYFVFTIDDLGEGDGLRYSTVDMNLAAGMGSVTAKNILLVTPSTEKLCAVRHCNGTDIWVISHDYPGNTFRSILVNSAGVSSTPVLSSVGFAYTSTVSTIGIMRASPSGRKVGTGFGNSSTYIYELYDFDNATGIISNPFQINLPLVDAEFSPDGTKLYSSIYGNVLYQLDLCAGSGAAIISSAYTTTCLGTRIQRAIDGKIYLAEVAGDFSVINQPDNSGAACNFVSSVVSTSPNLNVVSLPNFVSETVRIPLQFTFTNTPSGCNTASFSTDVSCPLLNTNFSNILWDFGDPASGPNNTSVLTNPMHTYPGPGTYTTRVIYYYSCDSDTAFQTVVIGATPINAASHTICSGQSATLNASGNLTYTWSTGQNLSSVQVSPSATTVYTVQATSVTGCVNSSTVIVLVNPAPSLSIAGNPSACPGKTLSLEASGATSFTWSNGTQSPVLSVSPASVAIFTLLGTNSLGCISQKTITTGIHPLPIITITGNNTLCPGSSVTNTAFGALTYTWSTGETTSTIHLSPLVNSNYTVIGTDTNGCIGSGIIALEITPLSLLNISPGRNVAPGSSAIISVTGGNTYTWTPADFLSCTNCSDPITSPANDIQYCVASVVNGCKTEACIDITVSCETGNDYSLPNAFSPNGDGQNDVFCLQGWDNCVNEFEVLIFDRWGEKVFSSDNRSFCWDGVYKGKELEADVFVYVIKANFFSAGKSKIITKKGNISLIR